MTQERRGVSDVAQACRYLAGAPCKEPAGLRCLALALLSEGGIVFSTKSRYVNGTN